MFREKNVIMLAKQNHCIEVNIKLRCRIVDFPSKNNLGIVRHPEAEIPEAQESRVQSGIDPRVPEADITRLNSPFSILHSCARDGRSALTPALFHLQFGESSSVSLGNRTSIAHLDHQKEDPGRILIGSSDLRSRKAPLKKAAS
uniref:Uncharacterized protein n=1 Tax=Pristionchus pacificus TaxID=54126 RepID=A0A2A6BKV9_PRIPA|eukprot:PDM66539.1 hypothetical protein PRIPAC_47956 [Pristionchus pacificus]